MVVTYRGLKAHIQIKRSFKSWKHGSAIVPKYIYTHKFIILNSKTIQHTLNTSIYQSNPTDSEGDGPSFRLISFIKRCGELKKEVGDEEEDGERKKEGVQGGLLERDEQNRQTGPYHHMGGLNLETESLAQNGFLAHETHCYG